MGLTNNANCKCALELRAKIGDYFLGGKHKSAPTKKWPGTRAFNIFNAWADTTISILIFLSTAGYFRNKNVLKHEAELLEKIRTF